MRGGWRAGAGRPGFRMKVEALPQLDVRLLARKQLLGRGNTFAVSWLIQGREQLSAMAFVGAHDLLTLRGTAHRSATLWQLRYCRTPCHFGGSRVWWLCPVCARRVAVVYLRGSHWLCRHCGQLAYSSQSEDRLDRSWRAQQKIENLLDNSGAPFARPKGMHLKTYYRLLARAASYEEIREAALRQRVLQILSAEGDN